MIEEDHPATKVYGILLHKHMEESRKDTFSARRHQIFDFIEDFRREFPEECEVWEERYK